MADTKHNIRNQVLGYMNRNVSSVYQATYFNWGSLTPEEDNLYA